jgi:hypothetical protein
MGTGIEEAHEHEDATASMKTGVYGQILNINGWFASHADGGTPGPHVQLVANGINGAVLKTSQIPELIEYLNLVAQRIDRLWEREGEAYPYPTPRTRTTPPSSESVASTTLSFSRMCARTSVRFPNPPPVRRHARLFGRHRSTAWH